MTTNRARRKAARELSPKTLRGMKKAAEETTAPTIANLIAAADWDKIMADGYISLREMEEILRAKGIDPVALDYLHE